MSEETKGGQRPVIVVVVAAGRSRRMGQAGVGVNKLLLEAEGRPVLAWTLEIFEQSPGVSRIYVTACEEDQETYRRLARDEGFTKVAEVVRGGAERQQSVWLALQHVMEHDPEADLNPLVAIHDGARPLLSPSRLAEVLDAAHDSPGGALLGVPAKETMKRVGSNGAVLETIPRDTLFCAQTPQVFPLRLIFEAHCRAIDEGFPATDDASLVERTGAPVRLVVGDYENIKITTPEDLVFLRSLLPQGRARSVLRDPDARRERSA